MRSFMVRHFLAFYQPEIFAGWPANNGLWSWSDGEILIGCVTGPFISQTGHNINEPYTHHLLRSTDSGTTWGIETPAGYVGTGGLPANLPGPLDFRAPGFALRVAGAGYHGSDELRGAFFCSADRGHNWSGPFAFNGLNEDPELIGEAFSPRTDCVVLGQKEMVVLLSVRGGKRWQTDRAFCAATRDGGLTFTFRGWLTPGDDSHRSVMPATVHMPGGTLVSVVRRRRTDADVCWLDAYASLDNGATWKWLSKVGDTGQWNGNPPALARLADNRLCCVYGNRDRRVMIARLSLDNGRNWQEEIVLRDDFYAADDEPDFGYPRLVCLPGGDLLTVYHWSTAGNPYQHIAATRFSVP
jgi:hypothetical protein